MRLTQSLGITFVIVSHELPSIYKIADRIIMLDTRSGDILASGDPGALRDETDNRWVHRFFNREAGETN